jgi:D-alanyl-D-alanine carboxypeptidase (penicillin-binding protein 5/6)
MVRSVRFAAAVTVAFLAMSASALAIPGTAVAPAPPAPAVGSASGVVVDLDSGKVLWAKDDQSQRAPASLTKILTAYVVLKNVKDLDETAVITPDARAALGSRIYAEEGWTFTVRDLLWGLLLQSGNDAAIALAHKESPDGTVQGFMDLANKTAAQLGAMQTHFVNPHGYDEAGHVTTARDLALITMAAMKIPTFAQIVGSKTHDIAWGDGGRHTFFNHNKLLWRYPGTVGVKTGFTDAAGHGLVSAVHKDSGTLITVLMDSPDHYAESIALYDWGFQNIDVLRAAPLAVIHPGDVPGMSASRTTASKAKNPVKAETKETSDGLEVVQLQPEAVKLENKTSHKSSAPLLAPLAALVAAITVGTTVRKRRRASRSEHKLMDAFQRELDSFQSSHLAAPEPIDA